MNVWERMSCPDPPSRSPLYFWMDLSLNAHRSIASDDEYTLFSVIVFKRFHDDFAQACRENKYALSINSDSDIAHSQTRFILRDFVYSDEEIAKQKQELEMADTTEKELWVNRMLLAHKNFPHSYSSRPNSFICHGRIFRNLSRS